jgi:hypothetical protein
MLGTVGKNAESVVVDVAVAGVAAGAGASGIFESGSDKWNEDSTAAKSVRAALKPITRGKVRLVG